MKYNTLYFNFIARIANMIFTQGEILTYGFYKSVSNKYLLQPHCVYFCMVTQQKQNKWQVYFITADWFCFIWLKEFGIPRLTLHFLSLIGLNGPVNRRNLHPHFLSYTYKLSMPMTSFSGQFPKKGKSLRIAV